MSSDNDNELAADVSDELFWAPKLDNSSIAVSTRGGTITLRGTVGSLREKREAKKAAQRVYGVISVDDDLKVKLMDDQQRADAELRSDVLEAADRQYQRDEAELVASNIVGALDVVDEIELDGPAPNAGDVQKSIRKAFKRNAALDADDLYVSSDNGAVTIDGNVSSWAEHDEALDAAWAAPGVKSAHDNMTVAY